MRQSLATRIKKQWSTTAVADQNKVLIITQKCLNCLELYIIIIVEQKRDAWTQKCNILICKTV